MSLRSYLLTLVMTVIGLCLLIVTVTVLIKTANDSRKTGLHVTNTISKALNVQVIREASGFAGLENVPSFVGFQHIQSIQGHCVKFSQAANSKITSHCYDSGIQPDWPTWFETLYRTFLSQQNHYQSSIYYRNKLIGELVVTQDHNIAIFNAWQALSYTFMYALILIILLPIALYLLLSIALKPIQKINQRLNSISENDLTTRLPHFNIKEWQHTAHIINEMTYRLQHTEQQNKHLTQQLITAQEAERNYISRELHDEMGQSLTGLKALFSTITRLSQAYDSSMLNHTIDRASQIANGIQSQCHHLIHRIRPPELDGHDLHDALHTLVAHWNSHSTSLSFELHSVPPYDFITGERKVHLYRIIQESITNIAKHAQATHASICLKTNEAHSQLMIEIKDNGQGMELSPEHTGFGLINIKQRITLLKGEVSYTHNHPSGLISYITIPINDNAINPCNREVSDD